MTTQALTADPQAAGLPDLAELARLANQLFAARPGDTPASAAAAPDVVPSEALAKPPAGVAGGRLDGLDLGSPPAYSAALPQVYPGAASAPAPAPGGGTGYYFSDPSAPATRDTTAPPVTEAPGAGELEQLLQSLFSEPERPTPAHGTPGFYFLDRGGAPGLEQPRATTGSQPLQAAFDVQAIRRDFPILQERVNGKPLVWLDNAATTHKPRQVIERISHFYEHENSNIHRAAHELAARATDAYEAARDKVARFLGARSAEEIVFVRGATEGINLLANTFGRQFIGAGDEIVISHLEHHANIVPWQRLANEVGAKLRVIPVDDSGQILLEEYARLLGPRTRLVAITQVSNALGTITPVAEIIALAHGVGAKVLVDGAQSVPHLRTNVQVLDADFLVFSGHKVFGPTGIGVLYGKKELLDSLPPWQGGGNMIADVTFERTLYQPAPARFEAGTGNIADAVGLGAALDYLERIGLERVAAYEHELLRYASQGLAAIPGLRLIGTAAQKASVLSFVLDGYRTEEVGAALNREGIAVRSGHHCAQPILRRFGLEATVRPSLAFYNTTEEVDLLVACVRRLANRR